MLGEDRRRRARVVPEQGVEIQLSVVTGFQVLEVNAAGMLLRCDRAFVAGERIQIHTMLANEPFSARVEITRVHQVPSGDIQPYGNLVAAAFVSFDKNSYQTLRRLLSRATVDAQLRRARLRSGRRVPGGS
jgi:hypothetical protein